MDTYFYKIIRPFISFLFKILFRPVVLGIENIPSSGGVILAGNHTKWLDPIALIAINKRQVHFLCKDELFHGITKPIVKAMGCISVNRKIHDKEALSLGYKTLEKNNVIGIFPSVRLEKELKTINMNTLLLAPQIEKLFSIILYRETINDVIRSINSKFILPYFSSIIGPIKRMYKKLPTK